MIAPETSAPVILALGFGFLPFLPMAASAIGSLFKGKGASAIPGIAGTLGRVFGGASKGVSDSAQAQEMLQNQRNQTLANLYGTQQNAQMQQGNLDLARQQFGSNEEGTRLRRALLGQLLGNGQPLSIDIPGIPKANVQGGLSLASLGQGGRDTAGLMSSRALEQLRTPMTFQGGQMVAPPQLPDVKGVGGNGFLNALGLAGSAIGALGGGASQAPAYYPNLNDKVTDIESGVRQMQLPVYRLQ